MANIVKLVGHSCDIIIKENTIVRFKIPNPLGMPVVGHVARLSNGDTEIYFAEPVEMLYTKTFLPDKEVDKVNE